MRYRLYQPEDFASLYAIEEACFQPPLRFDRDYMRQLIHAADSATWIAEDGVQMAGFAIVKWGETTEVGAAYIPTIEVTSAERGRGVGAELLRCCEESAHLAGSTLIWLHVDEQNAGAIRLYESHGYRCEGKEEHFYAHNHAGLIYCKRLDGLCSLQKTP